MNHSAPNLSEDEVMTIPEVARYLRLSEATVYRFAKRGKIPAMRIGRTWRFKRELVDAWLRQESSPPVIPAPASAHST